ncbi:hypothetical protein YC2023_035036 [Brassica napus]
MKRRECTKRDTDAFWRLGIGSDKFQNKWRPMKQYGEDDHSMEEDDDVGSDVGDNEEDHVVEKAKNLMI